MFSFAGDVVLDPFAGTGTTNLAALETGRNSIGVEIEPKYLSMIERRLSQIPLVGATVQIVRDETRKAAATAA
jgi:DNA modification methylase